MIKYLLAIFLTHSAIIDGSSQLSYLRLSPTQKIEQKIGATDFTLTYSRPSSKGRIIFGALVPYDLPWRTGANENTTLSFNYKIKLGDVEVAPGTYALFTIPGRDTWQVILYDETTHLDVPSPMDSSKIVASIQVPSRSTVMRYETLVINFHDISGHIGIDIPIYCFTRAAMEDQIATELSQNALDYSIAASYYLERDIELDKAKNLMELSIAARDQPSS